MLKDTSVDNNTVNEQVGVNDKAREIVIAIFKSALPTGLTAREMLRNYDLNINTLPATTAEEKTEISAIHQGLKGAKTALVHKGILKMLDERKCSITGRVVEVYIYHGIELTEDEQLSEEEKRRIIDRDRAEKRIAEIRVERAAIHAKNAWVGTFDDSGDDDNYQE